MVFGNNTVSDISKFFKIFQNTTTREAASGIWKILKYYEPVLLPNTRCSSSSYLFIIEAEKFSVTHKRPFFLRLKYKQTQASTFVTIFLRSMEEMIDSFLWHQYKPYSRQTTWNGSMKVIYKSRLSRSLQQWYNKATLLYHRFLLLYHYDVEIVML